MFACGLLSGYDSSLAFSYPELQMLLTFRDFDEVLLVVLRPSVVGAAAVKAHGTRTLCRVLSAWGGALPQGCAPPLR